MASRAVTDGAATPPAHAPGLRRALRTRDLVVHGLAAMVPVSVWGLFGEVHDISGGRVAEVYALGLVVMALTAGSYAVMADRVPEAGSVHAYARAGLGERAGFVGGWAILLDYVLLPTLLYVFAAESLHALLPALERWVWGLLLVALNLVIGLTGIRRLTLVLRTVVLLEGAFIAFFLVAGMRAALGHPELLAPTGAPKLTHGAPVLGALSIAVLSYLGFDAVSTLAEETERPRGRSRVGRAMLVALGVTGALLIAQSALAGALAPSLLTGGRFGEDMRSTDFFHIVGLAVSSRAMTAFLVVNVLAVGVANAITAHTASARLLLSMARAGQLPAVLARVNRRGVPAVATVGVAVVSAVLVTVFAGRLGLISSLVNVGALSGYLLVHLAVIGVVVRDRPGAAITVRRLLVPLAGAALLMLVLAHSAVPALLVGGAWIALGVVLAWARPNRPLPV